MSYNFIKELDLDLIKDDKELISFIKSYYDIEHLYYNRDDYDYSSIIVE